MVTALFRARSGICSQSASAIVQARTIFGFTNLQGNVVILQQSEGKIRINGGSNKKWVRIQFPVPVKNNNVINDPGVYLIYPSNTRQEVKRQRPGWVGELNLS